MISLTPLQVFYVLMLFLIAILSIINLFICVVNKLAINRHDKQIDLVLKNMTKILEAMQKERKAIRLSQS